MSGLDRVYPLAPKIGGLASGARQVGGTALYLGNQVYHSGCVTLALTGNIELDAVVAQGCRPIGEPMFVTIAHENLIRELDGRPPREVLARLFERLPAADRDLFSQSLFLGLAMRTDASEYLPGDFLIRNILGMDPQSGALWVSANVPANSVVQFHSARCGDLRARPGAHADGVRRIASVAARRRRAAVLLRGPRHGAVRPGRSRQQCVPPAGRRRADRRFLLQRRDRPDPERDLSARLHERVRRVPGKEIDVCRALSRPVTGFLTGVRSMSIARSLLASWIALAFVGTAASAAERHPFSVEDLVRLKRVADPALSPDGKTVVFTLRETDMAANRGRRICGRSISRPRARSRAA